MAIVLSSEQLLIREWFQTGQGHLVGRALAGTGKTFTLIDGVLVAPEQSILICCFNSRIETEIQGKVSDPRVDIKTSHKVGNRAVSRYWERVGIDKTGARASGLAEAVCGAQAPDAIKRLVAKLHTKGREMEPFAKAGSCLEKIAIQFDCVPDQDWTLEGFDLGWVCDKAYAAMVLAAAKKPIGTGIDFADMLYLPLRNRWLRPVYDMVVIDEAQDWTKTQLAIARAVCKPGGRISLFGDDNQAIYGFRGADSDSLDRLKSELGATELGLTITRRCEKAIVREAQRIVPRYQAAEDAGEGIVRDLPAARIYDEAKPGDFVLSRTTAPLVAVTMGLVRRDVPAKIEGRDLGAGLEAIIRKLATGHAKNSLPKFLEKLKTWKDREIERAEKAGLESKCELVRDQAETLVALSDGAAGIQDLSARIRLLFSDVEREGGANGMVVCSTIHRSKGLERDRVFLLRDTLNPPVQCVCGHRHPRFGDGTCKCGCSTYQADPKALREEQNIEYVGITRARHELVWVAGDVAGRR